MKYEVDVETIEEAEIQYVALVEADTPEHAIEKVKASIEEDGTAFMQHECIGTRVIETQKIDKYSESVEWKNGQDTAWVSRVHSNQNARIVIVIDKGTPIYVYSTQFEAVGSEIDVRIINFDTDGDNAEEELESVAMDISLALVYSREKDVK